MSKTSDQATKREKLVQFAVKCFSKLNCSKSPLDEGRLENQAIEAGLNAAEFDDFAVLSLWAALQDVRPHPLIGRTLSFALAQSQSRRPQFAEVVVLHLLSSPNVWEDVSSQLNLITALARWSRSDNGLPTSVMLVLPRFLEFSLEEGPLVRDASVELLLEIAALEKLDTFPCNFLKLLATKFDDGSWVKASDDIEFISNYAKSAIERGRFPKPGCGLEAAKRLQEQLEMELATTNEGHIRKAKKCVELVMMESEARTSSLEHGSPVQVIRVADSTPRPTYELVSSVLELWFCLFTTVCDVLGMAPVLKPLSSRPGSFIFNAVVDEAPESLDAFELIRKVVGATGDDLDSALRMDPFSAKTFQPLLETLTQYGAELEILMTDGRELHRESIKISCSAAKKILPHVRIAASFAKLESSQIPQADELSRVFLLVDLIESGQEVTTTSLGVVDRQINYYKHAGRVLNLLSDQNMLTTSGKQVARLADEKQRKMVTAVLFEESDCGSQWIRWSNVSTLADVDPSSAKEFIRAAAPALSEVTASRRAQTLSSWHHTLVPYHYTKWRTT